LRSFGDRQKISPQISALATRTFGIEAAGMSSLAEESADTASLERILSSIDVSPQTFLQPSTSLQAASLVAAKRILDPIVSDYSVFREVALKGLDVEQVWEQVRLVGENVAALVEKQKDLPSVTKSNGLHKGVDVDSDVEESMEEAEDSDSENISSDQSENEGRSEDDSEISEEQEEDEEVEDEDEDGGLDNDDEFPENPEADAASDEDMDTQASTSKPFKKDAHGLNDKFFSIDDFNRLTEQQDAADSDIGDDEIDYFGGIYTCPSKSY
jgi:U3 small nucleolar RNA-associated protein MPP10